ncbi:ribonuclease HI [Buchnera aphidicola]|uniref:Ribonuclease H n=1 Tax=Buchnera aphidicola (Aphis gossypii) TaxID=98785 RepID=A0A5J6Z9M8_9GAMM|nr:ribonuclease HI [Buchnera aphidicola]QFQ32084.1 ribonuclease HI [Buchnera aphidicola (Aphis gossypii)]UPT14611.1 ribonuclease HI [Buchnera aphidicola (Aphis gossypii)]
MLKLVKIFTDGSCLGNPGAGGYGTILRYKKTEKILTSGFFLTTNNRMELMGVISGLEFLKQSCTVEIFTDSRYVQNGVTKWMNKWKQQKWEKNNKKLIKNIDLWLRINDLLKKHCITWFWIKGHSGHIENELCDKIARQSANHPCIQDKFYEIVFYKKLQEKL